MSEVIKVLDITHPTSDKVDFQGYNIAELVLQLLQRYHWATYIDFSGFLLEAVTWKPKVKSSNQTSLRKALENPGGSGDMYMPALWWCLCAGLAPASSHLWDSAHLMLSSDSWTVAAFEELSSWRAGCSTQAPQEVTVSLVCCFHHFHGQLQLPDLLLHSCRTASWPSTILDSYIIKHIIFLIYNPV